MNARIRGAEGRCFQNSKNVEVDSLKPNTRKSRPSSVSSYLVMARGWESKAVESQIESIEDRVSRVRKSTKSPEEIARERQIEGLQLSRLRVVSDIHSALNPGYRVMLERSLAFLDEELKKLQAD